MTTSQKPSVDPGQQYGIIGIIMLVIGLPVIGIFVSIIGHKKSKKAGYDNTLAKVGIWLNAVFIIVVGLVIAGISVFVAWGVSSVDKRIEVAERKSAIAGLAIGQYVKSYKNSNSGKYPNFEQVQTFYNSAHLGDARGVELIDGLSEGTGENEVGYEECITQDGSIKGVIIRTAKLTYSDGGFVFSRGSDKTVIGECTGTEVGQRYGY